MSQNVPQWFIDMFEADVHQAYQREGARLEMMVRHGGSGEGMRVKFPKLGISKMVQKARHGQVPIAERDEAFVWCNIEDWYPEADMVDSLDELKTNIALRREYASSQSYAMGRKADGLIVGALDTATQETSAVGKIDLAKVNEAYTYLGNNSVPTVDRYFAVSPKGWTDLMGITEFGNADYIAENEMPYRGAAGVAKRWHTFFCFTQEGAATEDGTLPIVTNTRTSFIWHRRAIGYHRQKGPGIQVDWENLHQAWSIVGCIACGAVLIDDRGVYKVKHDETAT